MCEREIETKKEKRKGRMRRGGGIGFGKSMTITLSFTIPLQAHHHTGRSGDGSFGSSCLVTVGHRRWRRSAHKLQNILFFSFGMSSIPLIIALLSNMYTEFKCSAKMISRSLARISVSRHRGSRSSISCASAHAIYGVTANNNKHQ